MTISKDPGAEIPRWPEDIETYGLQQYLSAVGTEVDLETARLLLEEYDDQMVYEFDSEVDDPETNSPNSDGASKEET